MKLPLDVTRQNSQENMFKTHRQVINTLYIFFPLFFSVSFKILGSLAHKICI